MKSALIPGIALAAFVLCCGNCQCCGCGSDPFSELPGNLTEAVTDKVTQKITEVAIEEGAEYALEQMYGEGSQVELDLDQRHVTIEKDGFTADLWGLPDALPKTSRWPHPPEVTYIYDVVGHVTTTPDGQEEPQLIAGEVAYIEYPAEQRDAVVEAYRKWAEKEGFTVEELTALPEGALVSVPGLEQVGVEVEEKLEEGAIWLRLDGKDKHGMFVFGPSQAQLHYEGVAEGETSAFWWQ